MIFKISKTWILIYQKEYLQCIPSWSLVTQVFNSSVARGKAGKIKVLPEEELGGWDGGGHLRGFGQHLSTNLPGSILYFNNIYICVCVLSHFSCARLFATLWTLALQAPLSMGEARILEWIATPSSRRSSQPRDWTHVSCISCTGVSCISCTGGLVLYH